MERDWVVRGLIYEFEASGSSGWPIHASETEKSGECISGHLFLAAYFRGELAL